MIKPIKTHSDEKADALQPAGWKLAHRITDSDGQAYEFVLEWPHAYPPPANTFEMAPRFSVDFNELLERDLVMLSQADDRKDVTGISVALAQGLQVEIQEENLYDDGLHEILFARGVVEANTTGGWAHVKWLCRIDSAGIKNLGGD